MNIIELFKQKIKRIMLKKQLVLSDYNTNFSEDINQIKEEIISSMPGNIEEIEKAYYIYIELGKRLFENPINALGKYTEREELSYQKIDQDLHGNCKAIAELYVNILNDDRVGIDSELITIKKKPGSHVDAILNIDGKHYITNLISDLSRIKTGKRLNSFGFNLEANPNLMYSSNFYKKRVKEYYKDLSFLTREEVEVLDKKLGYSYSPQNEKKSDRRGIYTDDVFERIKYELEDPSNFEKYVLKGNKDVKEEDYLKYKLEFLFENMDKFSTYNGEMRYLENIRYYFYTLKKFFSDKEIRRLNLYACTIDDDFSHIYSILKVKSEDRDNQKNIYFFYDEAERKYSQIDRKELKGFVNDNKGFKIVGEIDHIQNLHNDELEL